MPTKGYFIITDISGYTEYLTKSELEHAHATLQGLFEAQLAHIQFPLHISGFRGDATFLYVPETDFLNPQSLVETFGAYFSNPDKEPPAGFHDFCEMTLLQGYGRIASLIQADIDSGKITAI